MSRNGAPTLRVRREITTQYIYHGDQLGTVYRSYCQRSLANETLVFSFHDSPFKGAESRSDLLIAIALLC